MKITDDACMYISINVSHTCRFVMANDGPMLFWGIGPLVVVVVVTERTD